MPRVLPRWPPPAPAGDRLRGRGPGTGARMGMQVGAGRPRAERLGRLRRLSRPRGPGRLRRYGRRGRYGRSRRCRRRGRRHGNGRCHRDGSCRHGRHRRSGRYRRPGLPGRFRRQGRAGRPLRAVLSGRCLPSRFRPRWRGGRAVRHRSPVGGPCPVRWSVPPALHLPAPSGSENSPPAPAVVPGQPGTTASRLFRSRTDAGNGTVESGLLPKSVRRSTSYERSRPPSPFPATAPVPRHPGLRGPVERPCRCRWG